MNIQLLTETINELNTSKSLLLEWIDYYKALGLSDDENFKNMDPTDIKKGWLLSLLRNYKNNHKNPTPEQEKIIMGVEQLIKNPNQLRIYNRNYKKALEQSQSDSERGVSSNSKLTISSS